MRFVKGHNSLSINGRQTSILFLTLTTFAVLAGGQEPQTKPAHPAAFHFVQPEPINFDDHVGWTQIFDGKTLNHWDGPSEVWHVEDGAIVGEVIPRTSIRHNKYHLARR